MDAKRFNYGSADLQHNPDNLQGTLLISTELQQGSPFEKAVILLMQDDKRGTFGVALNKIAEPKVRSAWEKLTGSQTNDQHVVVSGGPLQGPVFALHQIASLSDVEMPGGLHVSAQIENLQQLMMQFDDPYRIIVGVSGWKPGQLISEVNSGHWYSMPLDPETIFDDPAWMWEICLHEYGRQRIADIVGEHLMPEDPDLN